MEIPSYLRDAPEGCRISVRVHPRARRNRVAGEHGGALKVEVTAPPEGPTAEYGQYLVSAYGCHACHGPQLTGGTPPEGGPLSPNLTKIVPTWTEAEFVNFFRTGQVPGGEMASDDMPWKEYSIAFTDDSLKAVYAYLSKLPPVETPAAQ